MENAFFAQHISTLNHAILVLVAPICGTNAANKVEKLCSTAHCLLFILSSQIQRGQLFFADSLGYFA